MVIESYPYQVELINKTKQKMEEHGEVALCATCAAGKTHMANVLIKDFTINNPTSRVLVLAHGRTQLRDQFYSDLAGNMDVVQYTGGNLPTNQVVVAIPQSIHTKDLPQFDLVVIDEAHHFYTKTMVQNILKKTRHKNLLLLTGSAAYFVKNDFPRVMFSAQELRQVKPNALADVTTFIVQTTYDFKNSDYGVNNNLIEDVEMPFEDTKESLAMAIWSLINTLRRNVGKRPYLFNGGDTFLQKAHHYIFKNQIEKTMIAASGIKQANQIYDILIQNNITAVVSTSENDKDSLLMDEFYSNPNIMILIVVERGILGFDMPELRNIIDMSNSENPDIIFQLLGRASRNDHTGRPKVFVKVSSKNRLERTELVTCFALALTTKIVYESFNGNYMTTPFPTIKRVKKEYLERNIRPDKPTRIVKDQPEVIDLADYTEMLTHIKHKDDSPASAVAWVTLNSEFRILSLIWDLDACKQDASKYSSRNEWDKASRSAYSAALRNGWLDECCEHMEWQRITLDMCKEDALNYQTRNEWSVNSGKKYRAALYNGWLDECCKHMEAVREIITFDMCVEDAKNYTSRNTWQRASKSKYSAALRNGWVDECCKHMEVSDWFLNRQQAALRTLDFCKEDAKNYTSRSEWKRNSLATYETARRNNWLEECCEHMPKK